jgi:hypothetical protein
MSSERAQGRSESADALLAVLRLICEEVHTLAFDVTGLGETLSADGKPEAAGEPAYGLQAFDLLGQRLLAQARLLHGIEQLLARPASDWRVSAEAMIQAVPFHAQRQRLAAALKGQRIDLSDIPASDGGGADWF